VRPSDPRVPARGVQQLVAGGLELVASGRDGLDIGHFELDAGLRDCMSRSALPAFAQNAALAGIKLCGRCRGIARV
jgi:hypothetical protein